MFKPGDKVTEAYTLVPGETHAHGEVIEVHPGRYSFGDAVRRTGVRVQWEGHVADEWVSAALLRLDARAMGVASVDDEYEVDDTDASPFQDMLYLSDYHRAVEWVQAQYAYHAEWERELLYNPGDVERADNDWAREWLTAFRALWPHEHRLDMHVPSSPQVVGYFV